MIIHCNSLKIFGLYTLLEKPASLTTSRRNNLTTNSWS